MKETVSHGAVYGFGQTLASIAGFLLIPVYTRYLSPAEYGVVSLLAITSTILVSIFGIGLSSALFRSYYDYDDDVDRKIVVSTSFYLLVLSTLLMIVLGLIGADQLSIWIFGTSEFQRFLIIIFLTSAFLILQAIPFAIYRAKQLSTRYSVLNLAFLVIRLAIIIYLVVWKNQGIWGVVLGNFLASLFSTVWLLWTIRIDLSPNISRSEINKLLRFGSPLIIVNLSGIVLMTSGRYFIRYFYGLEEVGIYTLGYQIGMIIMILLVQPLKLIWPPMMFSVEKKEYANQYYSKVLTYFVFLGFFLFLGVALLSKEVIGLIANQSYQNSYLVVPLIALSFLLFGVQEILNLGMALNRRTEFFAIIFILGASINLLFNYLLIPQYGIVGAAISTFLSIIFISILKFITSQYFHYINYEWKRITKIVIAVILIFGIGNLLNLDFIWETMLIKGMAVLTYPILLYIVKFYDREEISIMKNLWSRVINI